VFINHQCTLLCACIHKMHIIYRRNKSLWIKLFYWCSDENSVFMLYNIKSNSYTCYLVIMYLHYIILYILSEHHITEYLRAIHHIHIHIYNTIDTYYLLYIHKYLYYNYSDVKYFTVYYLHCYYLQEDSINVDDAPALLLYI